MTASQLTDNPVFVTANEKSQQAFRYLASLPIGIWRNLLILLASIWMCHSLATLFWLVFPTPVPPQPQKLAVAPEQSVAGKSVNIDIEAIKSMNIFGVVGESSGGAAEEEQSAEAELPGEDYVETRLNLKLQGVIASSQPKHARAIIDDGKEQLLLRINEELPRNKGVKLARVMDKKVILDNKGKYETLSLYNEDDFSASKARSKNSYQVPKQNRKNAQVSNVAKKTTVKREQMPKSISDIVRFSVHRENGVMVGYRVRPGRERELFDQVGLKANDVVTTVNGIRMDDPKQLKTVYQSLKTATAADLGVLRNGEELSIHVSVEGE